MRPVDRGDCPCDDLGQSKNFYPDYTQARGELIRRLGEYCSYCERRIQAGLHVEHILPKRPAGHQEDRKKRVGDWTNFLLACGNCNSHKSNREFADNQCMFPDRDNTFFAITYSEGGQVQPSTALSASDRERAINLIGLVGLNARPTNKKEEECSSDRRWLHRFEAWKKAQKSHCDILNDSNNQILIDSVIEIAVADGCWSIWMTVFKDIPEVTEELISRFPGTRQ